ncbi:alpha/beta hydrolase [Ancylobacter terrae]|uniref:alpha/beta hydrolase n=1 Tax=Ancylobacter sp. sgz301288 TaxID=3342077 RepID=UPI0038591F43
MADPFRTRDHVPDFDRHVAAYAERSAQARARLPLKADIAYGPAPGERLDLFFPPRGAATGAVHMFVHGGYWRMFAKEDFSFVAETVTAAGAIAAIIDYDLMPAVRLETVVAQVRRARDWLRDHAAAHGGNPDRLTVSGHSAGAHLCALLMDLGQPAEALRGALLLSGLYDLARLQSSFLRDLIALRDDEVARFSPLRLRYGAGPAVTVLTGEKETPPFHLQAEAFAAHLRRAGTPAEGETIADADHMSIVADLGTPGTRMAALLAGMLAG